MASTRERSRGALPAAGEFGLEPAAYTMAQWDAIVRHGIKADGTAGIMPSDDYFQMSDQELSDIVAYIRSVPASTKASGPVTLGPVLTVVAATGGPILSADKGLDRDDHPTVPPPARADATFGKHLIGTCTGCHRRNLSGGPMAAGDPSWPPSANLTLHADGLAGWTLADFRRALREGKSKDGRLLKEPMSQMTPYGQKMTDTEIAALWAYLEAAPKHPTGTPE